MPVKLNESNVKTAKAPPSGDTLIWDDKVTGFGVRIFAPTKRHPGGMRSFFLNYRISGTERRYKIGRFPAWSVAAAREEAEQIRKRIDRGEDPTEQRRTRRDAPTVRELAERYRAEHLPKKSKKSQHDDWQMIENYILPFKANTRALKMGERKVTEIHDGDIKALHRSITASGHATGANRVLAVASKMFSLALERQAGEEKPWRDATLGNPCKGVSRNTEEGRQRFFSEAEIAAVSDALNQYSAGSAANCAKFIMLTGCRPGEAMVATWDQVDDEPGFWIKPALTTKQRKVHKLPLGPAALELLEGIRAERTKARKAGETVSEWIFPGQVDGQSIKQLRSCWEWVRERASVRLWAASDDEDIAGIVTGLRKSLKREPTVRECEGAAKARKLKLPRGIAGDRLYDLRHSYASIGIAGGYSLSIIGKLLGHTQQRTTQVYSHLSDDVLRAAAAKIGGTISNAGKGGGERVRPLRRDGAA
jgi:integrase